MVLNHLGQASHPHHEVIEEERGLISVWDLTSALWDANSAPGVELLSRIIIPQVTLPFVIGLIGHFLDRAVSFRGFGQRNSTN